MTTVSNHLKPTPPQNRWLTLAFDAFRLFPQRRQLIQHIEDVRIGARAFDLLTTLAGRAGEIVSYSELIEAAWPNRVVADSNLRIQITGLQKILGPAPSGGRYIKNIAMRGYVFVGDVHSVPLAPSRSERVLDTCAVEYPC